MQTHQVPVKASDGKPDFLMRVMRSEVPNEKMSPTEALRLGKAIHMHVAHGNPYTFRGHALFGRRCCLRSALLGWP
jgi:hypothetical protein